MINYGCAEFYAFCAREISWNTRRRDAETAGEVRVARYIKYKFFQTKLILQMNYHKSVRARRQTKGTVFTHAYIRYINTRKSVVRVRILYMQTFRVAATGLNYTHTQLYKYNIICLRPYCILTYTSVESKFRRQNPRTNANPS